jgi:putative pyruvate formate lyase activating enzyme
MNKGLERYQQILSGEAKAKFLLNNKLLSEKIREAYKTLERCELCERSCKVNRNENLGECKVGNEPVISSAFIHLGEEYFFVPSFTIFFMGCNFHCQFCQNYTISQWHESGTRISVDSLAFLIERSNGCKNINLVGGEPTPHLPFILDALSRAKINLPLIWNSNFYMSLASMNLLKGIIDVYLSDFKYGNNSCAEKLSKTNNYFDIVSRNHLLAFKDSELVVRHLVLPNHFECCTKKVLEFVAEKFGDNVILNLMNQYRQCWNAHKYAEISRELKKEEFDSAINYAEELGLNFIT